MPMILRNLFSLCAHLRSREANLSLTFKELSMPTPIPANVRREVNRTAHKVAAANYELVRNALLQEVQRLADDGAPAEVQLEALRDAEARAR